jgi:hypothetical protein
MHARETDLAEARNVNDLAKDLSSEVAKPQLRPNVSFFPFREVTPYIERGTKVPFQSTGIRKKATPRGMTSMVGACGVCLLRRSIRRTDANVVNYRFRLLRIPKHVTNTIPAAR